LILIDANLLLYAHDETSPCYEASMRWFAQTLDSGTQIGIPLQSILAFVRVSTNPRLLRSPKTMPAALAVVDTWLLLPNVRIVAPGQEHWSIFKRLRVASAISGNLATDAHLAALAIEHHAILYSTDRDFARFPGLRWANPLASA